MKLVILDANSLGERLDLAVFERYGELIIHGFTAPEEVSSRIETAEIIITNKVRLNADNLGAAKKLKLICLTATGCNNIDLEYTKNQHIWVSNIVGYSTESVVQHTFTMLFYLLENMEFYRDYVRNGVYIEDRLFSHYRNNFHEIHGKVFGIIGMGNIGRRVAMIAKAFGCTMIYTSRSVKEDMDEARFVDLQTLLKESDIVSIHAPLTDSTRDLIGYNELCMMKKDSILLNLGRGGIVNEEALVRVLEEDHLGGVGLDVLAKEPMSEVGPLTGMIHHPKLLITPHIAWASLESRQRMVQEVCFNIEAYLKKTPRNVVNL